MNQAANDIDVPDPLPVSRCGRCQYWGERLGSSRGVPALGVCHVRRGALPIYTPPSRACDVIAGGVLQFNPLPESA